MQIAHTVWTWMKDEFGRETPTDAAKAHFEEAVRSVSHLGYDSLENFNFVVPVYEKDPAELKDLLDRYNLKLVNLYHTYYEKDEEEYYDLGRRTCKILQACGANRLNVQGNIWRDKPFDRPLDKESILNYARVFTKMGEISAEYGIKTCLHPHGQTTIYHEDEIDFFLENIDSKVVGLTMDTAHTQMAGMDAPKAFDKYGTYINYVHLKDLDPNPDAFPDWPMERFVSLGYGCVDFRGVLRSLQKHNYDGVLCVEVDYPLVCCYETAMASRLYLRDVLNL